MKNKYNEMFVAFQLRQKHDLRVNTDERIIWKLNGKSHKGQFQPSNDVGIKSWGKIDFLTNHCGYRVIHTAEF